MNSATAPFRPVGLKDAEGRGHMALQLRKEKHPRPRSSTWLAVRHLKWGEQKRVFRMIPALRDAEFVRYGVMHRNTFINSPKVLHPTFQMRDYANVFLAGQLDGR